MRQLDRLIKGLHLIGQVMSLATLLLGLSLVTLSHSTAKSSQTPILLSPNLAEPLVFSALGRPQQNNLRPSVAVSNPVATAFINAVPTSDGSEILISVAGVNSAGSPIVLNIDPGTGPGSHRGSYAMTLSGTTYLATAIGFTPEQDVGNDGDDSMSLTTTVGSQVMSTGEINFQRAFVELAQPDMIVVDNGAFTVDMPNTGTFATDVYVLVMSTHASPGPLPLGYSLASSTYNMRSSGSLTQSEKFMTLKLRYQEPLPNSSDPHTLAVVGWNPVNQVWDVLEGDFFDNDNHLAFFTKRFRIYTLATIPVWHDSFKELSLTGVSARSNTQWGPGDTIILTGGATTGTITSIPITPTTGAANWSRLHFSATTSLNTGLTVDVLDGNDNVVLVNVSDGTDLSSLPLAIYPSLKLRAILTSTLAGQTPELHEWRVAWTPGVGSNLPGLALRKTAPLTATAGSPITYSLTVTNTGHLTATNLVITDVVPLSATHIDGGSISGNIVSWLVPSLTMNASAQVSFVVTASVPITNSNYRVTADEGISATGQEIVVVMISPSFGLNAKLYLPLIFKDLR